MSAVLARRHGACPACTTDTIAVWHTPQECARIQAAHNARRNKEEATK